MKRTFLLMTVRLSILTLAAGQAQAAQCAPRDTVVALLADRFGEDRHAIALAGETALVEIFTSDRGSWTITVTRAGGPTCILAAGEGFQVLPQSAPGNPA